MRLTVALLAGLMDKTYDTFIIDEPEVGISPEAQGTLADFLFDRQKRQEYFPHIQSLVIGTHSTVFLDRQNVQNNFQVSRVGTEIQVHQTRTHLDFNRIHFFLLGNRFETLFLPSAIVLVEGKTDRLFVERVLSAKFPSVRLSVIAANSDDQVKQKLHLAKEMLGDFQTSPYRNRIIAILDATHSAGLPAQLEAQGLPRDRIITWPENGIEHYYPPSIVDRIYGAGPKLQIEGDSIIRNGISYSKNDLAEKVVAHLAPDTPMHPEFDSRFLELIRKIGS